MKKKFKIDKSDGRRCRCRQKLLKSCDANEEVSILTIVIYYRLNNTLVLILCSTECGQILI